MVKPKIWKLTFICLLILLVHFCKQLLDLANTQNQLAKQSNYQFVFGVDPPLFPALSHEPSLPPNAVVSPISPASSNQPPPLVAGESSSSSSLLMDPMIQCRLEMEKWLNPKIDFWLTHDLPILDWVSILPDGILHIQIIREHIKHAENLTIRELFDSSKRSLHCHLMCEGLRFGLFDAIKQVFWKIQMARRISNSGHANWTN
jgi:hypothetical protein